MDDHDDYCLKDYRYHFHPDLLKGKIAFISGGASGIGFRISELLMRHGCDIVIVSRNIKKLEESAQKLRETTGRKCHVIKVDVREYNTVLNAVKEAVKMFGSIDILINAAAGNFLCPVSSMSTNAYKTVMEIDAVGTFNCTKAVFETGMKDHGGCIINISATLHYTGTPMQAHAGSAKAAIDALTRHLAVEWGPLNIRVNSVSPGPIEGTEGFRKLGGFNKDSIPLIISRIPLQRMGTRTDIAEACLFLASPLASYVTGAILVVDGGNWLTDGQTLEQRMKVASKL